MHPTQPTQLTQPMHPTHARQPLLPMPPTTAALIRTPALAATAALPITLALATVPALPTTPALATVPALPITPALATVAALPITPALPRVPALSTIPGSCGAARSDRSGWEPGPSAGPLAEALPVKAPPQGAVGASDPHRTAAKARATTGGHAPMLPRRHELVEMLVERGSALRWAPRSLRSVARRVALPCTAPGASIR
jgi:hypothetical protein